MSIKMLNKSTKTIDISRIPTYNSRVINKREVRNMDKVMGISMLIVSVQAAHDRIYKQSIAIKALAVMSILNSIAIVVMCFAILLN